MARSKSVGQGIVHNSGWHVPKRLLYIGAGLAALAAVAYVGVRLVTAIPEARPDQRANPTAVATPYKQPTPAVSQYQRQALEQIAAIRQKEPGLADVMEAQEWAARDNATIGSYELNWLQFVNESISRGTYTLDSLVSGVNTTTIFTSSKDEFRRTVLLQVVKANIPIITEFLGVKYDRSLLLIDFDAPTSGAAGGFMQISSDDWTLRNKTHETGHEVYEAGVGTPDWLTEGVAELVGIYAANQLPKTMPELASLMASPEWKGRDKTIPNFEKWYQNTVKIIDDPSYNPSREVAPVTKGFVFLYEFRQLVGQDAFAGAMGHLYDAKVARGAVDRNKRFTDKDIEAVLEQHVPPAQLPEFKQLYQSRVYGVQETKP